MYISRDCRVLVKDEHRALFVDKEGVVTLKVTEGLPADLRVDKSQDNDGRRSLERGLNLHPEMVRFLARDDVHEALKKAVHAQEYGWQQSLPMEGGQ